MRKRIGVLISGRGSNLGALIEAASLPDYPAEIALVLSNRPAAKGLALAEAAGIPTEVVDHKSFESRAAFDAQMDRHLKAANVDLVCNAGFMRILSDEFVHAWEGRMLNIHPSLLPSFKGLDVHQRVLDAGVRLTGCTVHFVTPEMDAGPIVAQAAVPVLPDDDAESLAARVLKAEHELYPFALRLVASGTVHWLDGKVTVSERYAPAAPLFVPPLTAGDK